MEPYYIPIGSIALSGIVTAVLSWFVLHIRPMAKRMMNMLGHAMTTGNGTHEVSLHRLVTIATCPDRPGDKYSNYEHCAHFYDAIRTHPTIWTIFFADRT